MLFVELQSDPTGSNESTQQRRRGSEPSLDRSMGSVRGAFNSMPPQIVIPRARHSSHQVNVNYAIHRGQVYMW